MGWLQRFWDELLKSINPAKYDKIDRSLLRSFRYYLLMVLLIFLLTCVLFIPALFNIPEKANEELAKFNSLELTFDYNLKEPIIIPESSKTPLLVIDTIDNPKPISNGLFIITGDALYYQTIPFAPKRVIRNEDNILAKSEEMQSLMTMLALSALPFLIITGYAYFAAKYLVVIIIASILGFILARVARFDIEYATLFRVGLHSSTVMVALALLTKPFMPRIGYLEYIIFIIFFTLGAIKIGEFEENKGPEKPQASTAEYPARREHAFHLKHPQYHKSSPLSKTIFDDPQQDKE